MNTFTPDDISSAQLRLLEFVMQQATGQVEHLRRKFEGDEVTSGDAAEIVNKLARAVNAAFSTELPLQPIKP